MAYITVTNTFSNSTAANATQVNQNFTDIINGTSDGTKDFNIRSLTATYTILAYTTTATAAGTTTLTVSSNEQQYFTGTTTQTVVLPVASTLVLGQQFLIVNNSTGAVTVQSSGANTITTMVGSSYAIFTCILTSGTGTASWSAFYVPSLVSANTASTGVVRDSSGNFSAGTITATLTGTASGNTTYTANQYGVVLSGSGNAMTVLAPNASVAYPLVSGGASANPSWALLGVAGGGTGIASGTSGGVPYFSGSTTVASSAALAQYSIVLGGGAGNAPATLATDASTSKVLKSGGSAANPSWLAYDNANTASTIVARDASGNFSAGTVTAALTGTASGNTTYTANQYGVVLSGSGNAMTVLAPDASTTKVLTSGGSSANPSWAAVPAAAPNIVSKTSAYTAGSTDDYILCDTTAAFTVTLAAASTKKVISIIKTTSDTNVLTVSRAGSDTINGATSAKLVSQYEKITLVSDGSATWYVSDRKYPQKWNNSLTFTFTNIGTATNINVYTRRIGDSLHVRGSVTWGSGTGGVSAQFNLPTGYTIDSNKLPSATTGTIVGFLIRGSSASNNIAGSATGPYPLIYDGSTTSYIVAAGSASSNTIAASGNLINGNSLNSGETAYFDYIVPITNWDEI